MGKKKHFLLTALLVCSLAAAGCGAQKKETPDVPVEYGDSKAPEASAETTEDESPQHVGSQIFDEEGIAALGSYEDAVKVTVELSD